MIIFNIKSSGDKHFFLYIDDKKIEIKGENKIIDLREYGKNVILEITDGKARFVESDCKDKICIKTGYIEMCGEVAVCLPNKVAIEIKCVENEFDAISQ
ncbi:NusG domain II-containing protein [Deferribacteraceae bacterium V6Fe1]|nr:NusG domain II-containing protein [Deferribacteraceae bacterium V6Fe1]